MTTEPVPAEPPVVPEEAAAQDDAAAAEAAAAAQLDAIRELATQIAKQAVLDFDPATIRKGTVTAIADTASPPTLSVQISGDTTTTISGVRYLDSYVPVAGDTALIIKQGTDLVALGDIAAAYSATAWTTVTLGSGWTHNGNSGGSVRYRRVWDNGSPKMQWRGVAARSGGGVAVSTPLASGLRPLVRVPVDTSRSEAGGAVSVRLEFQTDGTVTMVGGTTAPGSAGGHTHGVDITDNDHTHTVDIADNDHTHGVSITDNSHNHSIDITDNAHNHGGSTSLTAVTINGTSGGTAVTIDGTTNGTGVNITGATDGTGVTITGDTASAAGHTHPVDDPTWVSFNNIEYYLD